jgi:hypothetical protein
LLSRRESLLEGGVLGLPRAIDEKPSNQPGSRPGDRTKPGIPADGAEYGADTGACSGTSERALLGRGHISAGCKQHGDSGDQH